jgi:hypothetical protein
MYLLCSRVILPKCDSRARPITVLGHLTGCLTRARLEPLTSRMSGANRDIRCRCHHRRWTRACHDHEVGRLPGANVGNLVLFVNTRAGQNKRLQPLGTGSACPSFSSRVKKSIPKAFLNDSPVAPAGLFRQDASRFVRRQVNVDSRPSRPSS